MGSLSRLNLAEILGLSGGLISAIVAVLVFVFMNFALKADVKEVKEDVASRLNRLETKIDRVLENTK